METLFSRIPRSINRCSVASLFAQHYSELLNQFLWHQDENIFLSTRLLFPVKTSENFSYEILHGPSDALKAYQLEPGRVYSWDTEKLHRMRAHKACDEERISLLIGVSPWFDYLPESREWVSNAFYGEKHPLDMFLEGDLLRLS